MDQISAQGNRHACAGHLPILSNIVTFSLPTFTPRSMV